MPYLRIPNAGSVGVNKDLSAHELPAGVWTEACNVRFFDGRAHQTLGHASVYGTTQVSPHHLIPVVIGEDRYWVYAGLDKVYAVAFDALGEAGIHTNITRQNLGTDVDYSGYPNGWTSAILGGIPVLNAGNAIDPPQFWDLNLTNRLQDLTAWPASTFCASMRQFKNYLIALNVTKASGEFPFMVKWSAPAAPGTLPITWDETDATNDAGETDLAEGYDPIVDGLQLRDRFIIYKEASTWAMDYIGGPFVFRFSKLFGSIGALNKNCIAEVNGQHFVLSAEDVILHDGNQSRSILDNVTRRFFFNDLNGAESSRIFIFANPFTNEVFVCYPSGESTYCDKAMIWNYQDQTVSFREMPNVHHAAPGSLGTASTTWDLDTNSWDSDVTTWNDGGSNVNQRGKALMGSQDSKLYSLDASTEFEGVIPNALLERRGLALAADDNGNAVMADERRTIIKGVRPRIDGDVGEEITVSVGYHDSDPYADPIYPDRGVMTHRIGETIRNDCLVAGRYIALKFETAGVRNWKLDSLDIEFDNEGKW